MKKTNQPQQATEQVAEQVAEQATEQVAEQATEQATEQVAVAITKEENSKLSIGKDVLDRATKQGGAIVQIAKEFLPLEQVKTYADAVLLLNTAESVEGVFSLKVCKLFEKVKREKLYSTHYKTFESWAASRGVKKVTAYAKAKAGVYINDNGTATTLPRASLDYDFTFTQLVEMIESLVTMDRKGNIIDDSLLIESCKQGKLYPNMPTKDFKKTLKLLKKLAKGEDISEQATAEEVATEQATAEEVATEQATEQATLKELKKKAYATLESLFIREYGKEIPQTLKNYLKGITEYI